MPCKVWDEITYPSQTSMVSPSWSFGMDIIGYNYLSMLELKSNPISTQIAKFVVPTWGPAGSSRPQMGPMLAPWTLLSGYLFLFLTHWGWATHICVSKLTIIDSDNGLSPGRRQAIIWNHAGILSIGLLGTNFSEILIAILTFSFKKIRLKVSSAKWRPFCLGLNVLKGSQVINLAEQS